MDTVPTPFEALTRALEIATSQSALARICGVGQPAVWKWVQSSKRLPPDYVLAVESATGVSRHLLRPDIYPLEHDAVPPALPPVPTREALVVCDQRAVSQGSRRRSGAEARA